jgi:hypothetical protein
MEVEHKSQADAGSYSKAPKAELDAALAKNYVGVRFQQGKPILDRELNLLGALSNSQQLAQRYIGNGVPDGDDGFLISNIMIDANDFTIKKGRCLVNGYEAVLDADTTYKQQPLINEASDFNFADGSESIYDVHLHVDTREVSSVQDPALQNDGDIGFETSLREKVVWKVLVTKTGTLTDENMSDLCLLAQVDTKNSTPDNKRVTDRRVTGLTLAQIRQRISETPEDLTLNTLKVKNRVDVGTATPSPPPDTSQTLTAARNAANAARAAVGAITNLYDALNKPEVLNPLQSMGGLSLDALKQNAQTAKTAAQTAQRAVDEATNGDASQVLAAARTAAEQANIAANATQEAAEPMLTMARGIRQHGGSNPQLMKVAELIQAQSNPIAQSIDDAKRAATDAVTNANALDAALSNIRTKPTVPGTAALAVSGDSYMFGDLKCAGRVGIGTMEPTATLHVGGGKSVRYELGAGNKLSLGGNGSLEVDAPNIVGGRFTVTDSGNVGIGIPEPKATLHVAGGKGDLVATEGDFKIGDDDIRLKVGVDTKTGEVRLRAEGGASKLILGSGKSDALTIAEMVRAVSAPVVAPPSPEAAIKAANDAAEAGRRMSDVTERYCVQYRDAAQQLAKASPETAASLSKQLEGMIESYKSATQSIEQAKAAAGRAREKSNSPRDVPPEVVATAASIGQAVEQCNDVAQGKLPEIEFGNVTINYDSVKKSQEQLLRSMDEASGASQAARTEADKLTQAVSDYDQAGEVAQPSETRSAYLTVTGDLYLSGKLTMQKSLVTLGTPKDTQAQLGEVVGAIGFYGYNQSHAQLSYRAGNNHQGYFEFVECSADDPSLTYKVDGNHPLTTVRGIFTSTPSDLAENHLSDLDLSAGDVVCLDPHADRIIPTAKANETMALGVVSTKPGFLLNDGAQSQELPPGTLAYPVALCGRVPCKVTDENGAIRRGDLLTSSSTPGHAMKAAPISVEGHDFYRPATIIGKALEAHDAGKGVIEIFITLC